MDAKNIATIHLNLCGIHIIGHCDKRKLLIEKALLCQKHTFTKFLRSKPIFNSSYMKRNVYIILNWYGMGYYINQTMERCEATLQLYETIKDEIVIKNVNC